MFQLIDFYQPVKLFKALNGDKGFFLRQLIGSEDISITNFARLC